jgi:S1-C subfamily serine protease
MNKQYRLRLSRGLIILFVSFLSPIFPLLAKPARSNDINSCKYLVVTDFTSDPYGIAKELRTQGSAKGFEVVSAVADVSTIDFLRTCVMSGSWSREVVGGGQLSVRVADAPSGALIAEASAGASRMGVSRTVRALVAKIYTQLGYTSYDENVYLQRIQREYPTRPKLVTTEEEIKRSEPRNHVEGIWSDTQDQYRLGIVPAPSGSSADYFAIVLRSNSPLWEVGEIKAEIRSTSSSDIFTCTYFMANKKPTGTTLTLDHDSVLRGSLVTSKGSSDLLLLRVWPSITEETANTTPAKGGVSGTGFLLSRSGLLATNWHVVADAKNISVTFPGWNRSASAEVVIRDVVNDLAVLRVTDPAKLTSTCTEIPFQLTSSNGVRLGERVSTIGYPLTSMLGSNPKFSEGVVSSKSGWQDDPRSLQISAQVQPGSSGSPLFDGDGNVVGVVVATLDAAKVYQAASALPQNVNFAIKTDYLLNLLAMIPSESLAARTTTFSPEKAAQCVAIVSAW